MIGTWPVANLRPRDYSYALDAAMPLLSSGEHTMVICRSAELAPEVYQRIPAATEARVAHSALWVEPMVGSWGEDLERIVTELHPGGTLAVVASQPLARLLPECRGWSRRSLGMRWWGMFRLQRALARAGFPVVAAYGIHSPFSIGLSALSQQMDRLGRPDLGDKLIFAARLHYVSNGRFNWFSTVALLIARKEVAGR